MKTNKYIQLILVAILSLVVFGVFPAEGKSLTTVEATAIDVPGTFTLILYGGRHFRDVEALAILDLEGDQYTIEPYAPEFDYRIIRGLSAKDALERAEAFLGSHYAFRRAALSKILDDSGKTIGYEVRPFYSPLSFGLTDVLDVDYALRTDGKVRAYIHLKPQVERQLFGGSGNQDGGGR
jgi:hypothetical protein